MRFSHAAIAALAELYRSDKLGHAARRRNHEFCQFEI